MGEFNKVIFGKRLSDSDIGKLIQANYDSYSKAFKDKDIRSILAMFTPDFEWRAPEGEYLNRAEAEAAIREQMEATAYVHEMTIAVNDIRVSGNQATVQVSEQMDATLYNTHGQLERQITDETYSDVWMRTSKGWRLKIAELLTSQATIEPIVEDMAA